MSSVIYYSLCIAGARANGTKPILTGKLSSYNNCQGSLLIISNSLFPRLLPPSLHRPAPGDVSLKVWRAEASMGLRLFSDALRDLEDLCCIRPKWTEVRNTPQPTGRREGEREGKISPPPHPPFKKTNIPCAVYLPCPLTHDTKQHHTSQ